MSDTGVRSQARGACAGGLVALGDSITNGEGGTVMGVYCRSWAHWLALAMDLPFHGLARDGATAPSVVAEQLPRVREGQAVGAVFAGVNDVRSVDFALDPFRDAIATIVAHIAARVDRTVVCTIPLDLGRPRAGEAKVTAANEAIRAAAVAHDALVAELTDLRGPLRVWPDAVHPTAVGQLEIADRAARVLGVAPLPSALVPRPTPRALVRFAGTGLVPALVRDARRRAVEAGGRRSAALRARAAASRAGPPR